MRADIRHLERQPAARSRGVRQELLDVFHRGIDLLPILLTLLLRLLTFRCTRGLSPCAHIEAFLAFDGGDRIQLCEEIWNVASPKVNYYWRDGTFDALEELRTRELNHRTYGNGRGL